jgi:hypothetical protein
VNLFETVSFAVLRRRLNEAARRMFRTRLGSWDEEWNDDPYIDNLPTLRERVWVLKNRFLSRTIERREWRETFWPWGEIKRYRDHIDGMRRNDLEAKSNLMTLYAENETLNSYKALVEGDLRQWVRHDQYDKLDADFRLMKQKHARLQEAFDNYDKAWREAMNKHGFGPPPKMSVVKD